MLFLPDFEEPGSSVSLMTRLRNRQPGFSFRERQWKHFFSPPRSDQLWGPSSPYSTDIGGSFSSGKASEAWTWPFTSV